MPDQRKLAAYADILVRIGVNVQKDQPLVIRASTDIVPFVRLVAEKAYAAGARSVEVDWNDQGLTRLGFEHQSAETLERVPAWAVEREQDHIDQNACLMYIAAEDPDLLSGIDEVKVARRRRAFGTAFKEVSEWTMKDRRSWLVASAPSLAWAKKMFPDQVAADAVEHLWEAIFKAMRIDRDDPVAAWRDHIAFLGARAKQLNDLAFASLHYTGPGTDLTIGLADGHHWVAADAVNDDGTPFVANLPTEEVYTAPHRERIDGVVSSTMPLVYSGVTIEGIRLRFEKGRVIEASAKAGEKTLLELLETDEGAKSLGEVSLVPVDSPISEMHQLFYETLFDENAACHVALGEAYPTCLKGGRDMSRAELEAHGANDSITHVDFMIGSGEIDIDGIGSDGRVTPVFRRGRWAF